ncbi:putative C2H2 type zinc finger protein [Rhizoctonia solani 123E]|uniref:Putative C2H2 type zinc finger protein n=1 Tax=Rhizoctonia solani 123E TaxID=1423351 RepID=A0A074RYW8_9AGAM|nr:putative C2H2 type zinc finger protein [Rhizoctonia solani 123E]
MLRLATMSGKRRRHSTSSSNEQSPAESRSEDHDLETNNPDGKIPRTSGLAETSKSLVCSLPPACAHPRQPTTLGSLRELEEHYKKYHTYICLEGNCRNEPGGAKIFPDARMLELHQTEYHDELATIKNERGESIFACFLESCPKKFRTPKGRRLHLIDVHGYPKLFFFAVTKHGIGGLLARHGEGATLIRKPWKPRPGNSSTSKNDNDSDEESQISPDLKDAGDQATTPLEAKTGVPRASAATPQPREDLDDLASSMKSLSLVPTSIRFGRGARRVGFIRRGAARGGASRSVEERNPKQVVHE